MGDSTIDRSFWKSPSGMAFLAVLSQYDGFVLIMFGFLLQWPTLVTLATFPVLVVTYVRLARREEREVRAQFGAAWDAYAAETPAFVPRLRPHRPDRPEHLNVHV